MGSAPDAYCPAVVDHPDGGPGGADADLAAALAEVLTRQWAATVEVRDVRRLSGGASRETWSFTAEGAGREQALILQRVRPGPKLSQGDLGVEDALIEAARSRGVPVPRVVVDSDAADTLGAARITELVPGEALGPRLVRADRSVEGRRRLTRDLGRALAGIHAIPVEGPLLALEERDVLGQARDGLDLVGEARPAFELGLRWLQDHRPAAVPPTVLHGDFRIGNLLVEGDDLMAVLDWELAHRGDPLEDLGWLCVRAWRFGGTRPVGGIGEVDDLLAGYRDGGGAVVDEGALRWWTAAGTLTWGLICAVQARRHLGGDVSSVELATVGRRVCENEYDLLDLIGVVADDGPADTSLTDGEDVTGEPIDILAELHHRPTSVELLDAVRVHLRDRVAPLLDGADAFSLRVVDRALATVQREAEQGAAASDRHRRRLDRLGVADEAELAAQIRAGEVGADEVGPTVRQAVVDRLRVADPRWLHPPDV